MQNWGITKRVLRTDADLEEAIVDIQEDQTDLQQIATTDNSEEVEQQLQQLAKAPGQKLYEQWMQEEKAKDDKAMEKLLADAATRKSLSSRYSMLMGQNNTGVQTIPNEVFMNFNKDENEIELERQTVLSGNLSKYR